MIMSAVYYSADLLYATVAHKKETFAYQYITFYSSCSRNIKTNNVLLLEQVLSTFNSDL